MTPAAEPCHNERDATDPERWLDRHGDYLYRFALAKVRRPEVAEDLVQETLLAGWRGRNTVAGRPIDRPWLTGILKHKIADWLRGTIRERGRLETLDDDHWLDGLFDRGGHWKRGPRRTPDAPDAGLRRVEFWARVHGCLGKLPARMRDAFVFRHLDDRDSEAICQDLQISSANLWVILHRARLRLWACLSETVGTDSPPREGPGAT